MLACLSHLSALASTTCMTLKSDQYMALVESAVEFSKMTSIRKSRTSDQPRDDSDRLVKSLWDESYDIMAGLTSTIHGGDGGGISLIARALLPSIMMTGFPTVTTTIPKEIQAVRKRSLAFLLDRVENGDDKVINASHNALQLLLQHICMDIPDKAEYRHLAHSTIGELLERLVKMPIDGETGEGQHASRFISFLLKYGRHKKPIFRLFAVEVAEELLLNSSFVAPIEIETVVKPKSTKKKGSKSVKAQPSVQYDDSEDAPQKKKKDDEKKESDDLEVAAMDVDGAEDAEISEDEHEKAKRPIVPPTVVFSETDHFEMLTLLASFLLERSSDKIVNVRAKAIAAISTTLDQAALSRGMPEKTIRHYESAIRKVYFAIESTESSVAQASESADKTGTPKRAVRSDSGLASPSVFKTPEPKAGPQGQASLVNLIKRRLQDERSTVRKSSLQLLETVCRFAGSERIEQSWIDLFKSSCFDPLLIIRKQAAVSLGALCLDPAFCANPLLLSTWVQSVPVLAFDAEQSVQDTSLKSFMQLVLDRVLKTSVKAKGSNPSVDFDSDPQAWTLFLQCTQLGGDANARTFGKLCSMMIADSDYKNDAKSLLKFIVVALQSLEPKLSSSMEVDGASQEISRARDLELACWKALAALVQTSSQMASLVDSGFVFKYWNRIRDNAEVNVETKLRVLHTVAALVTDMDAKTSKALFDDLSKRLSGFSVQPSTIQACTQLLVKLTDRMLQIEHNGAVTTATRAEAATLNIQWMTSLLAAADSVLATIVIPSDQGIPTTAFTNFVSLEAVLFTVGEVAQFLPKANVPPRLITLLQTFIATTFKGIVLKPSHKEAKNVDSESSTQATVVDSDSASQATTKASGEDEDELTVKFGRGSASQVIKPKGSSVLVPIPASTRALAYVSLGKLCLQDFTLAKTCIAAFARELEMSPSSIVRNNVMVVMCDLVVRYSNLVDNYLSKLTVCLRDESEMVRRQSLVMLTTLLQQEFIKLRQGNLFFPLLLTLVDDSEVLRQFAQVSFENVLSKHGGTSHVFFSNLIETIFFLNDYRSHPLYNQYPYTARERQIFNLAGGGKNRARRFTIYKLFFDHMEEQHKYQVAFKLCEEVLQNCFLDGSIPFTEEAQNLLYDVLCILTSDEIRLKSFSSRVSKAGVSSATAGGSTNSGSKLSQAELEAMAADDDIGNEKNIESTKKMVEATGMLAAQVVKRTTIERMVPIFIEVRAYLAKQHSPLLKLVMDYLANLVKEMPEEMSEVLENNPQLATELAYETRLTRIIRTTKERKASGTADSARADAAEDGYAQIDMDDYTDNDAPSRRPKPGKAKLVSLTVAATAPTPWKRTAPEIGLDFAVPKLRTGATPYKPSPAVSRIQDLQEVVEPTSAEIVASTPRGPAQTSRLPLGPPMTPGDISSPMASRMRRASLTVRLPTSQGEAEGETAKSSPFAGSFTSPSTFKSPTIIKASSSTSSSSIPSSASSSHLRFDLAETSTGSAVVGPSGTPSSDRHAKRPRFVDSDSDSDGEVTSPSSKSAAGRREIPTSPTAKKPVQKRAKLSEKQKKQAAEEEEATAEEGVDLASSEAASIALSPAKSSTRSKRKR